MAAHPELVRAEPPVDALLTVSPERIELWLSEAVATGGGSPGIRLLDDAGQDVAVSEVAVDPADPRRVSANVAPGGPGTYTVAWTARSDVDGHTLTGSFAFRVGGGRAPGAATVAGDAPQPWAVATRWLTFLGAAVAGGGYLVGRVVARGAAEDTKTWRRRQIAIGLAAAVALLATAAEPALQTAFPPSGAVAPALGDALRGLPDAWWLRPATLLGVLALGAAGHLLHLRGRRLPTWSEWIGLALALGALLGLSLTSHAAARDGWRGIALGSNIVHQWSVALWVGGLVHLALGRPSLRRAAASDDRDTDPVLRPWRAFSRIALVLALVGIATGVVNAGLVLPLGDGAGAADRPSGSPPSAGDSGAAFDLAVLAPDALWDTRYGWVLLVKVAVLMPVLLLATFHRRALRRTLNAPLAAFGRTVRVEAVLAVLVVLGGSVMALMASPEVEADAGGPVILAASVGPLNDPGPTVRLKIEPADAGRNRLTVGVAGPDGAPLPPERIGLVRFTATSLSQELPPQTRDLAPLAPADRPAGAEAALGFGWATEGLPLSLDGWWWVEATIRRAGEPDLVAPFALLLPDPNAHGFGAVPTPPEDPAASAVWERGLATQAALPSLRYAETLSDGSGAFGRSDHAVVSSPGAPAASDVRTGGGQALISIGERQWLLLPNGTWSEREGREPTPIAAWGEEYAGATGFRLGPVMDVDGEACRVVTFVVPGTARQTQAWYAWWIGVDTGLPRREAMVSRAHYMTFAYADLGAPIRIASPVVPTAATPAAATPATGR